MVDFIVTIVILSIVALAIFYIQKEKKKGVKCIGCPFADTCSSRNKKNCNK